MHKELDREANPAESSGIVIPVEIEQRNTETLTQASKNFIVMDKISDMVKVIRSHERYVRYTLIRVSRDCRSEWFHAVPPDMRLALNESYRPG